MLAHARAAPALSPELDARRVQAHPAAMPRLFVAIRPPDPIRHALAGAMGGIEGARWQDDGQIHLTLRFCGEIESWQADDLHMQLSRIAFAPFPLAIAGTGCFEKKGRVHTLWAGLAPSAALSALQARVERACRQAGLEPESRSFTPHVTLARMALPGAAVAPWLADHALLATPPWQVDGFALYESTLTAKGARYTRLAEFAARQAGAAPIAPAPRPARHS